MLGLKVDRGFFELIQRLGPETLIFIRADGLLDLPRNIAQLRLRVVVERVGTAKLAMQLFEKLIKALFHIRLHQN